MVGASLYLKSCAIEVEVFNDSLIFRAEEFRSTHLKATLEVFSSHRVLVDMLDYPTEYGFEESDVPKAFGRIWCDGLHLTEGAMRWIGLHLRDEVEEFVDGLTVK